MGSLGSAKAGPRSCPWHLLLALKGVDKPGALLRLGSEVSPVGLDLRPATRDGEAAPPHGPDALFAWLLAFHTDSFTVPACAVPWGGRGVSSCGRQGRRSWGDPCCWD